MINTIRSIVTGTARIGPVALLFLALAPLRAETIGLVSRSLSVGWENRYVSQGRDNLQNGGIYTIEGVAGWRHVTGGVWFAEGDGSSYQELNLFLTYALTTGPLETYLGYNHLRFPDDDAVDNEIIGGVSFTALERFTPSIDYTYSTVANGGFLELSVHTGFSLLDERLVLEPSIRGGFDFGYIGTSGNGAKNLQFGISASYSINEHLDLHGSVSHSWAHDEHPDFDDVSWITFGVSFKPQRTY